ncbi:PH domain-containing protein [Microbacterium sp. 10M-3C3]|uniref:PH domain-containing protein n=1 Tax=Microbacterium sp. 10M-3C3 TaxID=2483401 RepID=UPI000F6345B1|nr:PH domain-containing protein [Microbacterium sp. 10M-3C3]
MAFQEVTFRPIPSRVLAVVTIGVCAVGVGVMVWQDPSSALRYAWALVFVGFAAWALFWRPRLAVQEHGVTVVNVLRTTFVSWPAIQRVDTRYALTLFTTNGRVPVWVSPAPGRHRAFGLARADFDGVAESAAGEHGSLRPSDALSTTSGGLAHVIRSHWEQLRDAGLFDSGVEPGATRTTWHVATIATLAVLAAATLAGLLVP